MSAVRAAKSISSEPVAARVDVQVMQDLLYDILATGVDCEQASVSTEAVERFLHEHARAGKSPDEFLAFFARHGLTVSSRPPRPASAVALPPIQRPAQDDALLLKFPVELGTAPSASADALELDSPFAPAAPAARAVPTVRTGRLRAYLSWGMFAAAIVAVAALGYVGFATMTDLEQRLESTHAEAQLDRQAIAALEDQQVDLESNVAASAQIIERVDQKSDLILETIQPPAKKFGRGR